MGTPPPDADPAPRRRRRLRRPGRGKRRRFRDRFDLKKAMFVLPNLFTVGSIFCGFFAISLCLDAPQPGDLRRAAMAIFIGMFLDMFDGRVARLTRTQSEFGMQLDSLADAISFGVAPGVLLYRWMLSELGFVGLFVSFLYVACGALRLARFNVIAAHDKSGGGGNYFVGLPIPLAAGAVVAAVWGTYPYERSASGALLLEMHKDGMVLSMAPIFGVVGTLIIALLMVSTVKYRTFKKLKPTPKTGAIVFGMILMFMLVSLATKTSIALGFLFMVYISVGLVEAGLAVLMKTLTEEVPTSEPPPAPPDAAAESGEPKHIV
ncbi:MAG: CDP-diacylglycerol--serine O-phosphatidyltransferase [Myxococcota bacterium]